MLSNALLFHVFIVIVRGTNKCYWNNPCSYGLFSTKTPYDAVRGDIREVPDLHDCTPISLWSLHRHGNRNPQAEVIVQMKNALHLQDDIISSYNAGNSQMCAQDIEDMQRWSWNVTIEESPSYLTGAGYEELFDLAKRIRQKYPQLLNTSDPGRFYFRPTDTQRTVVSSAAFIHGLTKDTGLNLTIDGPLAKDDVIKSYQHSRQFQENFPKTISKIEEEIKFYFETKEFIQVITRVQRRLGLATLSAVQVNALYELCRYHRTWTAKDQSPWCAAFAHEDLIVLEYIDDIKHYYRNGYGSAINVGLGGMVTRDLYKSLETAANGRGKNVVSYFSHDTMMEMFFCYLGLFKDHHPITSAHRNESRHWRTSYMSSFASNFIAVLHRCDGDEVANNKIQFFINEREVQVCSKKPCIFEEFQQKFQ